MGVEGLEPSANGGKKYPQADSNRRLWLRRPTLYPLSYGGKHSDFTTHSSPVKVEG